MKTKRSNVSLPLAEYNQYKKEADKLGLSFSGFIRFVLKKYIRDKAKEGVNND